MQFLLNDLLKAVKGGKALSIAMQSHEKIFGSFYISMVRSGEASGLLSEVLDRLVEYLENAKANRDSVVSALIYPAILLVVAVLSIVLMLGFVVPQFESLFEDMGEALPLLTQMVLSGADFIKSWGWLLLIVIIGGGIVFRNWSSTDQGRAALDRRMLGLPLAGGIVFEFEVSKFARTTGTLLGNGVSLLKAISIAIDTVDNRVIRDALQVLPPAVKGGQRMSIALEESKMFTPMVIQMIRVGEESGSLDKMLLELAKVFDDHVQSGVKRGLALLEPILILTMGFIIAVIIIAILMGILSVNNLAV
jgi:general secretion pathway protein F